MAETQINYILENSFEPIVRIRDSILLRELHKRMGDRLGMVLDFQQGKSGILWGRDPFREDVRRIARQSAAYGDSAVQEAIGGATICKSADVQREMDRLSGLGLGSVLRNMRDPNERMRYLTPGSSWEKSESHVLSPGDTDVLVQAWRDGGWNRRFLVAGGEIACDTPLSYSGWESSDSNEGPLFIPADETPLWHAPDMFKPLVRNPPIPHARDIQLEAARNLLQNFDMPTGAIDVVLFEGIDGTWNAQVEEVHTSPPGGFDTFWAPADVYAECIVSNIHVIEPEVTSTEDLEP